MNNYIISVIIPIYNRREFFRECICSIIGQTYKNLEIIIVDDGSDKDYVSFYEEITSNDERIILLKKNHEGVVPARKAGIRKASGDYVAFLDSDDWVEPDWAEHIISMAQNNVDAVWFSNYYRNYTEDRYQRVHNADIDGVYKGDECETFIIKEFIDINRFYSTSLPTSMSQYVIKRNIAAEIEKMFPNDLKVAEDVAFTFSVITKIGSVAVSSFYPYHYRHNMNSVSNTNKDVGEVEKSCRWIEKMISEAEISERLKTELFKKMRFHRLRDRMLYNYDSLLCRYSDFCFPYRDVNRGSKVVIYGFGHIGKQLYHSLDRNDNYSVVAIVDSSYERFANSEYPVSSPNEILDMDFDYVLVTVTYPSMREEITQSLIDMGVDSFKIQNPDVSLLLNEIMPNF